MIGSELAGRYTVLEKIGQGAMGEVYLVNHQHLERQEALKILHADHAHSPELLSRFRREARATNRLQHPNIIAVYDFGQLPDGRFFLTTEYAKGETVDARLDRISRFSTGATMRLFAQVADAIDHAHSRGVIHRDLKPDNMVIVPRRAGQEEQVKVVDFGIAKIIAPDYADSLMSTDPSDVLGTPPYMAPEQVNGNGSDPRSDIYALGCVVFELLAGQPPFIGGWIDIMQAHVAVEPPRICDRRDDVSLELQEVILKCLAKDPEKRFQTGSDVRAALAGVPAGAEIANDSAAATGQEPIASAPAIRVNTGAATTRLTREDLELAFQLTVRKTAEALVDCGCRDFRLTVGRAEITSVEGELERIAGEIDELQRRLDAVEQRGREFETSLRFAMGELRFDRQQAEKGGEDVGEALPTQLAKLEQRLGEVTRQTEDKIEQLTDRATGLLAEKVEREHELAKLFTALDVLVEDLASRYVQDESVQRLVANLTRLRSRLQRPG